MNLNPFAFGIAFWNNWQQEDDREFVLLSFTLKIDDGTLVWSVGAVGFGFVFSWLLPF